MFLNYSSKRLKNLLDVHNSFYSKNSCNWSQFIDVAIQSFLLHDSLKTIDTLKIQFISLSINFSLSVLKLGTLKKVYERCYLFGFTSFLLIKIDNFRSVNYSQISIMLEPLPSKIVSV